MSLVDTFLRLYVPLAITVAVGALAWIGAGQSTPPSSGLATVSLGIPVFLTALNYGRHKSARLWVEVSHNRLILRHRLFGASFDTRQIDLANIASAQQQGQTLLIQLRSGPLIREPLPALQPQSVAWIASLIEHARGQNADFWREQLGNSKPHAALQQIVTESSPQTL